MRKDEVSFILECIEFIAAYGHRFLSLYEFDSVTGDWTFRNRSLKHHFMKAGLTITRETEVIMKKGSTKNRFRSYLEYAYRLLLRLHGCCHQTTSIPDDIDQRMVLFRV